MTCIVGVVHKGTVIMGADSCASDGYRYTVRENSKLFRVGDLLIGGTGSFRAHDLLRYGLETPRRHQDDAADRWMRVDLVNKIIKLMNEGGFLQQSDGVKRMDSVLLIGYHGRLFQMQSDLSVIESPPWGDSVGSGMDAALGSLFTTRNRKSAKSRVLAGLGAAQAVITTVRGPFVVKVLKK